MIIPRRSPTRHRHTDDQQRPDREWLHQRSRHNALIHGRPPTLLRLWAQPDRVTVTVTDTGPGPTDPLVGLLPPDPLIGPGPGPRLGLWLSHQLVDVAHRHGPDGYTIRLAATPPL